MTKPASPEVDDPTPEPEDTEESGDSRRMDPELKVLAAMLRLLKELPNVAAQGRVVGYMAARFYDGATK